MQTWVLSSIKVEEKGGNRGSYYEFQMDFEGKSTGYTFGTRGEEERRDWLQVLRRKEGNRESLRTEIGKNQVEIEDLPKILQSTISLLSSPLPWRLVRTSLYSHSNWFKFELAVPFTLKEMPFFFTSRRLSWDWSLSDYRLLTTFDSFNLVLIEINGKKTVLMQGSVQISPRRHVIVQKSVKHANYQSEWKLTDCFWIEKSKETCATLVTRFIKTNAGEMLEKCLESFKGLATFLQIEALKTDLDNMETPDSHLESDLSISQRTIPYDEPFIYGRGTEYVRDEVNGGLVFLNKVLIGRQRHVLTHLLSSIASNLTKGQSIMNISLPVNIFEPRSMLERLVSIFGYAPIFLEQAASKPDLERLKQVLAWCVTLFHLSTAQTKPFNPLLGETFQANLGSATCYIESIHVNPHIGAFDIEGKGYKIVGYHEWLVSTGTNTIKGRSKGRTEVWFGLEKLGISLPWVTISGSVLGKRVFNWTGVLSVVDPTNFLYAEIVLNPDKKGIFTKSEHPIDYFKGKIAKLPENHAVFTEKGFKEISLSGKKTILDENCEKVSEIEGFWPLYMDIDRERIWTFEGFRPFLPSKPSEILPSDSRFRADIEYWSREDPSSQVMKEKTEAEQRHDQQLRVKFSRGSG